MTRVLFFKIVVVEVFHVSVRYNDVPEHATVIRSKNVDFWHFIGKKSKVRKRGTA